MRALALAFLALLSPLAAQDSATGAIHGSVLDPSGSRIAQASIVAVNSATGARYSTTSDAEGRFSLDVLPPATTPPAPSRRHVGANHAATPRRYRRSRRTRIPSHPRGRSRNVTVSGLPRWSKLNPPPSPRSSTNAPSPIFLSTAAASPTSCCSRPESHRIPAASPPAPTAISPSAAFADFKTASSSMAATSTCLLRPGPRPLSRSVSVLQRGCAGVPRLHHLLRRRARPRRRSGH